MHTIRNRVKLRLARCSDLLSLQHLCRECFPVEYPESWYADLVSGSKYITIVATLPSVNNELVIGMIVAEYREIPSCRIIDQSILHSRLVRDSTVMYILSLGVSEKYRNSGIASNLLAVIVKHAKDSRYFSKYSNFAPPLSSQELHLTQDQTRFAALLSTLESPSFPCRAVYLHTLRTNTLALNFYQRRGFVIHRVVRRCYLINGQSADGYSCVLFLNGGYPQHSMIVDLIRWIRRIVVPSLGDVFGVISSYARRCHRSTVSAKGRLTSWLRRSSRSDGEHPFAKLDSANTTEAEAISRQPLLIGYNSSSV